MSPIGPVTLHIEKSVAETLQRFNVKDYPIAETT